jgi:hypothetical protein
MFQLKRLSREAIAAALEKAEQYRLLNEPRLAESICLDVLEVDAHHPRALTCLLLARTDQFTEEGGARVEDARAALERLAGEYERLYYAGIICERWARALLAGNRPGRGPAVYDWFRQAMDWYEKAERLRPAGHDEPLLRWNTCARTIMRHADVRPEHAEEFRPLLE